METIKNSKNRLVAPGPISAISAGTWNDSDFAIAKTVSVTGSGEDIEPITVAAYIEAHPGSSATTKRRRESEGRRLLSFGELDYQLTIRLTHFGKI
jgi:hypothetical protein